MKRLIFLFFLLAAAFTGCDDTEDTPDSKFNVLTRQVNHDNKAGDTLIALVEASSDVEWTAEVSEADAQWLTLVKDNGKGSGRVIFSLSENKSIAPRSASISVSGHAKGSATLLTGPAVVVTQLGSAPSVLIEPSGSVNIPSDAVEGYVVEVVANMEWSADVEILSGEAGWISVISPAVSASGSGQTVLSVAENTGENMREARLTVAYTADETVCATLTITQLRAPAKYDLTIVGMDGTLPLGNAALLFAPAAGESVTRSGSVTLADGNTSISYDMALPAGDYTLLSVTPEGAAAVELAGRFSIGEESFCTWMEPWHPLFESFGGESPEHPIRIGKPVHLYNLALSVNEGENYSGHYFRQTADISLAGYDNWVGIGSAASKFAGVYDGDKKTVSALNITSSGAESVDGVTCGHALFRHVGGEDADHRAVIRDLTVSGAATGAAGYVGGIVSRCTDFTILSGCESAVTLKGTASGPGNMGGIVSVVLGGEVTIENCVNRGEIIAEGSGAVNNVGGIAGQADGISAESRVLITGCRNYAKITYQGNSGGILGTTMGNIDIARCANYGEMAKTGTTVVRIGGVVGSFQGDATLRESFNAARIDGYRQTGGVIGWCLNTGTVENCYNRAEIVAQGSTGNTGGVVGNINTKGFVVKNCYNAGRFTQVNTSDDNRYAAIAGSGGSNTSAVTGCYYEAGKGMIGGLGRGTKNPPEDIAGQSEAKSAEWFTSGTPVEGWNSAVWTFSAGGYPTLTENPEKF